MKIGNLEVYGIIYKITNKVNGKVYIGQTTNNEGVRGRYDISKRLPLIDGIYRYHLSLKNRDKRSFNAYLFYSIKKYGLKNFEVIPALDVAFSKEELDIKEKGYILMFKATNQDYGYNIQEGGYGGKNNRESVEKSINTQIKNGHTRFINQLETPSLRIIRTYPSISTATKTLGLSRSSIKNVLNPSYNSNITAGGYAWEYRNSPNPKYANKDLDKLFKNETELISQVTRLYIDGSTYVQIAKIVGYSTSKVHNILSENKMLVKKEIIRSNAKIKRKQILRFYIGGKTKKEIRDITGYSKSIVEKAIEKYEKGIVDINGVYMKINNKEE